jgi:hypothetical protein
MAEIHFTGHLRNLVTDGPLSAAGATVGEALMNVLAAQLCARRSRRFTQTCLYICRRRALGA